MIFNTLLKNTGNQLGILVSNDNDFLELFTETTRGNLKICKDAKEIQKILSTEFNVISAEMVEGILTTNKYLMKRILSECGMEENATVYRLKILSCEIVEDDVDVHFVAMVDGIKYSFDITYNINANELIEAFGDFFEESEDE